MNQQLTRPPLSLQQRDIIEIRYYPNQILPKYEGIELDIATETLRLNESNSQWLSRQGRGLHREFKKRK